jgi:hypothetical protein
LPLATATVTKGKQADAALQDWANALDGPKIEVDYLDIFGKRFHNDRAISTKQALAGNIP